MLRQLENLEELQFLGLTADFACIEGLDNDELMRQEQIAQQFGKGCWVFATKRAIRNLWMVRGWPVHAAAYACPSTARATRTATLFKQDFEAYTALRNLPVQQQSKMVKEVLRRSCFVETSVVQCCQAFQSVGYEVNTSIQSHIIEKNIGMVATQAAEDSFHHMKMRS